LRVSTVGLGSWKTYGGGGISDEQARECIETAFACGINFIDTASVYSNGASESFLGGRPSSPSAAHRSPFRPRLDLVQRYRRRLIAADMNFEVLDAWGVSERLNVGPFSARQCKLLDHHRAIVFRGGTI
jgi:predicted oxidoreductase